MATTKLETVLAYVPMFHELSKREIRKIAALCDVADFMAGASIVSEGEGRRVLRGLEGAGEGLHERPFHRPDDPGGPFRGDRGPRRRGTDRDSDLRNADDTS